MTTWTFESGHTAAGFKVKHMMVTWIRGSFNDVHGTIKGDFDDPANISVEAEIDAGTVWSGHSMRDEHLKGEGFLDVKNHPKITFKSTKVEKAGENNYKVTGDLTIRGVTKEVVLDAEYLGSWETPFWEEGVDKGPKTRAGFVAITKINRHDFGVSWQSPMDKGGVVVGDEVFITIDVEAIRDTS
ncbi:polyisoprenoid-binding protein [Patescibacteria group bacterium]|nr:polyisoprenoid-binding protein [Patescibacteria group bacterium]